MPKMTTDFQSLSEEYQQVIRLAQDKYKITIAPLQLLVGGWSGAVVYLVSVASHDTGRVEVERNRELIQSALTEDQFASAREKGNAMTIDQAISFASNE